MIAVHLGVTLLIALALCGLIITTRCCQRRRFWIAFRSEGAGEDRIDPFDRQVVEMLTFLRSEHLPGVDTDDEQRVASEEKQLTSIITGSGFILSVGLTGYVFAVSKPTLDVGHINALKFIFAASAIALIIAFFGVIVAGLYRGYRVRRRYTIYNAHRRAHVLEGGRLTERGQRKLDRHVSASFQKELDWQALTLCFRVSAVTFLGAAILRLAYMATVI